MRRVRVRGSEAGRPSRKCPDHFLGSGHFCELDNRRPEVRELLSGKWSIPFG